MTISTTTQRVAYAGNGSGTDFPIPFAWFDDTDIVVREVLTSTGAETLKSLTTHYTLAGGNGAAGTLTMLTAPASGTRLVITGDTARTQTLQLVAGDSLRPTI